MFDRKPAMIVQCKNAADVAAVVNIARGSGSLLSVKGGGHHLAGTSINNDGIVIDLSNLRGVQVDPKTRTARVEGGALLGDLDVATQQHGLAVPAGIISHTGVAGLTLGGGFGWISRKHGFSVDSSAPPNW
jgi:FAD/FMN-containing dehydrogenase